MTRLTELEGIGSAEAAQLEAAGIDSVETLLEKGAHTKDRERIADESGLTYEQILAWVNRADFGRIPGIPAGLVDLLAAAGVANVSELARRNAPNLAVRLSEVADSSVSDRPTLSEAEVASWIVQAKELPRQVWYETRSRRSRKETTVETGVTNTPTFGAVSASASVPLPGEPETVTLVSDSTPEMDGDPGLVPGLTLAGDPALAEEVRESVAETETARRTAGEEPVTVDVIGTNEEADEQNDAEDRTTQGNSPGEQAADAAVAGAAMARAPVTGTATEAVQTPEEPMTEDTPPTPTATVTTAREPTDFTPSTVSTPERTAPPASERTGNSVLWSVIAGIAILGLFGYLLFGNRRNEPPPEGGTVAANTSTIQPSPNGEAVPDTVATEPAEAQLPVLYDGGAEAWMRTAAEAFNRQDDVKIKIGLTPMGSREGRDQILYTKDKVRPVLWNPGDTYWTDKLKADAANPSLPARSGGTVDEVRPILRTYLVLLMSEDKADAFRSAMETPEYTGKTWKLIHELAVRGWTVAGAPAWGKLKMAQTDPTRSNSGMASLVLIYQEWAKEHPGKSVSDKEFIRWMAEIQKAVVTLVPSTHELTEKFITETAGADVAVVYESEAVRAMDEGAHGMKIVYPAETAQVTLPLALIKAPWVTDEQATAGKAFMDYLMSDPVQEQALSTGYRPVSPTLTERTKSYFGTKEPFGAQVEPRVAPDADSKTKEGVIFVWNQRGAVRAGGG